MQRLKICQKCFEKQQKIDKLEEEIKCLKAKLKYETKKIQEGYFGSSTPSSQFATKCLTRIFHRF